MTRAEQPGLPPLDWERISQFLAEQAPRPLIVLDGTGAVRLVNAAFERFSGWRRSDLRGEGFVEVFVPESAKEEAARWLAGALRDESEDHTLHLHSREGRKYRVEVDSTLVCEEGGRALVLSVASATAISELPDPPVEELRYEIATRAGEFGKLLWSTSSSPRGADERCHNAFHGAEAPCEDCPVRMVDVDSDVVVRRSSRGDTFEIIHARRAREGVAHVRVLRLSEQVFSAMAQAKLEFLAADANLSSREMSVLRYLAMGRSVADIAVILEITPRTVKFHQANIIEKLGLDSRADLIRMIF